jgi:hypothetical protein
MKKIPPSLPVRIKDFAAYLSVERHTAAKYYKSYLAMVNKKAFQKLTISEVAFLDDLSIDKVYSRMFS